MGSKFDTNSTYLAKHSWPSALHEQTYPALILYFGHHRFFLPFTHHASRVRFPSQNGKTIFL